MKNCGLLSLTKVTAGLEFDASNPLLLTRCPKVSCPLPILKRRSCLLFRTIRFKPETEEKVTKKIRQIVMLNRVAISSSYVRCIAMRSFTMIANYPSTIQIFCQFYCGPLLHCTLFCRAPQSEKMNSLRSRGHCCQQKTNIKP